MLARDTERLDYLADCRKRNVPVRLHYVAWLKKREKDAEMRFKRWCATIGIDEEDIQYFRALSKTLG